MAHSRFITDSLINIIQQKIDKVKSLYAGCSKIFPANKKIKNPSSADGFINLRLRLKLRQITRISTMIWFLPWLLRHRL